MYGLCANSIILQKELDHPWIWVSLRSIGTNPWWVPRDGCWERAVACSLEAERPKKLLNCKRLHFRCVSERLEPLPRG